jgi:hypothetical protein
MSRGWGSLEPRRATGVIVRRLPVRVTDISATGCMLESGLGIREGAVGTLHLTVEGRRYRETVRVTRVTALPGSGRKQQVGAQFLTLGASRRALRHLAASMNVELMDGSPLQGGTPDDADRWDGLRLVKPDGVERSARTVKG